MWHFFIVWPLLNSIVAISCKIYFILTKINDKIVKYKKNKKFPSKGFAMIPKVILLVPIFFILANK